ncbi:MAG: phosphate uptake regulator PhoU [Desulfurococcales archaeon]|nr:phosphate uptake regulator PhoU [Desulfurococcales archaeon]
MGSFRRRIQLTGKSTYTVSLPKEWVRNLGLGAGDELSVDVMPDYSLKVYPLRSMRREVWRVREVWVNSNDPDASVMEVLSAYLAGYDTIKVKGAELSTLKYVAGVARKKAIGLEILEEGTEEVTLYSVMNTSTLTMRQALDKVMSTVRSMLDDVEESLISLREEVAKSVVERDDVVDKLFLLVMRQLNQALLGEISLGEIGLSSLPEAIYVVIAVKSVERIGDHAVLMAQKLVESSKKLILTDEALNLFRAAKEAYIHSSKAFRTLNRGEVLKVLEASKKFEVLDKAVKENVATLMPFPEANVVLDSVRRVKAYSLDIAESALNLMTLREVMGEGTPIKLG